MMYKGINDVDKMREALAASGLLSAGQEDALSVAMGNYLGEEEKKKEDIESVGKAIEPMVRELAFLRALESGDEDDPAEEAMVVIAFCKEPMRHRRLRIIDDEDDQYQWSEGYDEMLALKAIQTAKVGCSYYTKNKHIRMTFDFASEDK